MVLDQDDDLVLGARSASCWICVLSGDGSC